MRIEETALVCFETARAEYQKATPPRAVPHDMMMQVYALSQAESLKRIADALDSESPRGSVLYYLEQLAGAANAARGA